MNVWNCGSGCNGNVVLVFSHKGYGDQFKKNTEDFPKMVEKYNALYGEDAYKEDTKGLNAALEMLGKKNYSYEVSTRTELKYANN